MFAEWVAHGAEIGIVAFFAIAIFLMFCAAILGFLAIGAKIFEDAEGNKGKENGGRA